MGIKDRRTKILLSLLLLSDVKFEYVSINGKLQNIFDLSFNQKTRGTISGLIREGLIEKPQAEKKTSKKEEKNMDEEKVEESSEG